MSEQVLTTGQVARICKVAPRTVSKWVDSGQLPGYRIPGSKDRRVPMGELVRFMRAHGIPTDELDEGVRRVVVFDEDADFARALAAELGRFERLEVFRASSVFEVGVLTERHRPYALAVSATAEDLVPRTFCRAVRKDAASAGVRLIAIGAGVSEGGQQALLHAGFDEFVAKPFDAAVLVARMEGGTG